MIRLEHVGIAVDDAATTLRILDDILGERVYKQETVPEDHVRTHFMASGGVKIELLESVSSASPIQTFLDRKGPGLHHLAFEVPDIDAIFRRVQEHGFDPIDAEPRRGADGKRIFFLHPKQTGRILVEFCQQAASRLLEQDASTLSGVSRWRVAAGSNARPPLLYLHSEAPALDPELLAAEVCPRRVLHTVQPSSSADLSDLLDQLNLGRCHVLLDSPDDALLDGSFRERRFRARIVVDAALPASIPQEDTRYTLVLLRGRDLDRAAEWRGLGKEQHLALIDDAALRFVVIARFIADRD